MEWKHTETQKLQGPVNSTGKVKLQKACICILIDLFTKSFYEEERESLFRRLMETDDKVLVWVIKMSELDNSVLFCSCHLLS